MQVEEPIHSRPLTELLTLAAPTVAQMASYTLMQFIDRWMLSRLGENPATAVSNSGMLAFSLIAFGMGTLVIVNTLVSQSYGRGEFRRCGQYMWQGIWLAIFFGIALLPMRAFAAPIFHVFGHPPDIASMEAAYYKIVLITAAPKLMSTVLGQFFLGIDRPNAVLIAAVTGVSVNAITAWCIVLGHAGFSPGGVVGAAWAQNIGVMAELTMIALLALRPTIGKKFGVFDAKLLASELTTLIKIGIPSGLQWFSDVLAWSIFMNGVVGLLGPSAMAANTFMFSYMVMGFMPVYGLSTAVQALVGRYIGRARPDIAVARAHLGFTLAGIYMVACGFIYIFARAPLMRVFTHDPQIIRIGGQYLICAAIYGITDALFLIYIGGLRGAGDTLIPALVSAGLCWSINVGGGYLVARYVPQLGFVGPWFMACIFGTIMSAYIFLRFIRGGWRAIHLVPEPASNLLASSATL